MTPQHREEISRIINEIVSPRNIKSYLEIGCRSGFSLYQIGSAMQRDGFICAVDEPNGPWGVNGQNVMALKGTCRQLHQEMGHRVHLLLGNSQVASCATQVAQFMTDNELDKFDLVFIDADHTYTGVARDWELYGGLGRVVIFDDIRAKNLPLNHHGEELNFGVWKLWDEIKLAHEQSGGELIEIVAEGSASGKGVIYSLPATG